MTQPARSNQDTAHVDVPGKGKASVWTVGIDELPGSADWLLEIDSPHVYLTLRVAEVSALARAVPLLNSALVTRLPGVMEPFIPDRDDVVLGYFGEAAVHLLRDNEDFARCFLVIQQQPGSALRVCLDEGDIGVLAVAISQAIADLPQRLN